jgi:ATP-dependent helicase Lhr and Lhr-like helicase
MAHDSLIAYTPHSTPATALAALPEPLARWFVQRFGSPTPAQCLAWPAVTTGCHFLLSAPTGAGKTLGVFLPLFGPMISLAQTTAFRWQRSGLRGLYVSPLKALVNDVCRNLQQCLEEIAPLLPPSIALPRLAVRTGDTPAEERRRLLDEPSDVLLTTPESLAVLLSQPALQPLFADLRWLVIDEIHALAANKRGADLALSLERLTQLGEGELQRIGLSATATPLTEAAQYLAGVGRACTIAQVVDDSPMSLTLRPLEGNLTFVRELAALLEPELRANRATLVFTNARGLTERLAWALRRAMPDWDDLIAVHHSALAAERRCDTEQRFKSGTLRAIVCSTSLELGVDMGLVDLVVLVHPPGDVVRLLQRVGRAGHGPGRIKRGLVLTSGAAELLEAAVTGASSQSGQCEPLRVPQQPLDVLCQQLLGMACVRLWQEDEAFALVRRAYPYRELPRKEFDDCLRYLAGRDGEGLEWLPPRVQLSEDGFAVVDERTARLLRRNLGTILAEETIAVELAASPSMDESVAPLTLTVGEVEEAFAERLNPGDRFLLDGRCLEYRRRHGNALVVEEVMGRPVVPRWGGDGWPLSPELAQRLYVLRLRAAEALREGAAALADLLRRDYGLQGQAAETLAAYFHRQESISEIPETPACLIEIVDREFGANYYVHTPLNRTGNDALARVAVHRLVRDYGCAASSIVADLGFALLLRRPLAKVQELLRRLLDADGFAADLDASLSDSQLLRERFRRVATTGLMLLRNPLGRRRRVGGSAWGEQQLFDQVRAREADFVLVRQALREVRGEGCDVEGAIAYARQLPRLAVRCRRLAQPSPFAENWTQLAPGAVEAVETPAQALQRLHARLLGATEPNTSPLPCTQGRGVGGEGSGDFT